MKPTDEQISAWLDGTLPPDEAARFAKAMEGDEEMANRIDSMKTIDALVRQAVPLDDAVPPVLMERLGLRQAAAADNVVPFRSRASDDRPATSTGASPGRRFATWQIAAQIALVACVGIVGVAWFSPATKEPEAAYRALSASGSQPGTAPAALVIFDEAVDAQEASLIARSVGAEIAGEQTATGAWPLSLDPAEREDVLARLRLRDDVVLAEPMDGR